MTKEELTDFINNSKAGDKVYLNEEDVKKMNEVNPIRIRDVIKTWSDREFQLYLTLIKTSPLTKRQRGLQQDILEFSECLGTDIEDVKRKLSLVDFGLIN